MQSFAAGGVEEDAVDTGGFDARSELAELVTDFAPLIESVSEKFEAPLPLPEGTLDHPWLAERGTMVCRPLLELMAAIVSGPKLHAFVDPGAERMVVRDYAGRDQHRPSRRRGRR